MSAIEMKLFSPVLADADADNLSTIEICLIGRHSSGSTLDKSWRLPSGAKYDNGARVSREHR